jgi:SNF2 family DNA or RNA helicase
MADDFDFGSIGKVFGSSNQSKPPIVKSVTVTSNTGQKPTVTAIDKPRPVIKQQAKEWLGILITEDRFDIQIFGPWSFITHVKDKLRVVGYHWDGNNKVWYKDLSRDEKKRFDQLTKEKSYLDGNFSGMFDPTIFNGIIKEVNLKVEVKPVVDLPNVPRVTTGMSEKMSKALMPHQWEGIRRFDAQGGMLLNAWSMGCGKTLGSAAVVAAKQKDAIVVCPVNLMKQWKEELIKWEVAKESEIVILSGNKKQIVQLIYSGKYRFYIINYEKLSFFYQLTKFKDIIKMLGSTYKDDQIMAILNSYSNYKKILIDSELKLRKQFDKNIKDIWKGLNEEEDELFKWIVSMNHQDFILIYDETFKIKNQKSQLFKAHKFVRKYGWFGVIALNGTPMENSLGEFFNILDFVKPGWMRWWDFQNKFAWKDNWGGLHFKNIAEFNRLASEIMYRLTKEDVRKDLPPITQEWRFVTTSKEAHNIKQQLIDHALAKAEETGNGNGVFEVYQLLRTLDSYFNPSDETRELHGLDLVDDIPNDAKFAEFENVLEEIGDNQIIVFTAFERTAKWVYENLKKDHRVEYVSSHVKNKDDIRDRILRGDIQIVIATDVWARGADFPEIDYLIQYDLPFTPAAYAQRRDRIYRINSSKAKTIINMVGDVIEESIYQIIKTKTMNFELAVDGIPESEITKALAVKWGFRVNDGMPMKENLDD